MKKKNSCNRHNSSTKKNLREKAKADSERIRSKVKVAEVALAFVLSSYLRVNVKLIASAGVSETLFSTPGV